MHAAWALMWLWGGAPRCIWRLLPHAALHAECRLHGRWAMATAQPGWPAMQDGKQHFHEQA